MPQQNVSVQWQIATNESMSHVVRSGIEIAVPELAHSIRVNVRGLEPNRWYWYQFKVGNEVSTIGRTRTAPGQGITSSGSALPLLPAKLGRVATMPPIEIWRKKI